MDTKQLLQDAADLLRDIEKVGGLKQGGEQYPNVILMERRLRNAANGWRY